MEILNKENCVYTEIIISANLKRLEDVRISPDSYPEINPKLSVHYELLKQQLTFKTASTLWNCYSFPTVPFGITATKDFRVSLHRFTVLKPPVYKLNKFGLIYREFALLVDGLLYARY